MTAIYFSQIEVNGDDDETDLFRKAELQCQFVHRLRSLCGSERRRADKQRLLEYMPPSLKDVSAFITCGKLTAASAILNREVKAGRKVGEQKLKEEMYILMACFEYRQP